MIAYAITWRVMKILSVFVCVRLCSSVAKIIIAEFTTFYIDLIPVLWYKGFYHNEE